MTCTRCNLTVRQGMTVTLPDGTTRVLHLACLRDALQAVLGMLAEQTIDQALDALAGVGDGVALEQALKAAGLSNADRADEEGTH